MGSLAIREELPSDGGAPAATATHPAPLLEAENRDQGAEEQLTADGSEPTVPAAVTYKCKGCRLLLFGSSRVRTHGAETAGRSSVLRVGDEGLCSSSVFLSAQIHDEDESGDDSDSDEGSTSGYAVRGDVIYCLGCGNKLGKYCALSATCGCGSVVSGPVLRFIADRVDLSVDTLDTTLMQMHAKIESEHWDDENGPVRPSKTKRKKKIKERPKHKGNYSVFRDKTFIRNASRKPKDLGGNDPIEAEKAAHGDSSSDDSA